MTDDNPYAAPQAEPESKTTPARDGAWAFLAKLWLVLLVAGFLLKFCLFPSVPVVGETGEILLVASLAVAVAGFIIKTLPKEYRDE